jgi:hypothetical protein
MVRSVYQNGTASAPPKPLVQNPGSTSVALGFVYLGNVEGRIGQILGQDATCRTAGNAKRSKPSRRRPAETRSKGTQATRGDTRQLVVHIRPPPGNMPGLHTCENGHADS